MRTLIFLILLFLSSPVAAQQVRAELESFTGKQWTSGIQMLQTADGDSAIALTDSLWHMWQHTDAGRTDYLRCPTEAEPFPLASLKGEALKILDGRDVDISINGAFMRRAECITLFGALRDSLTDTIE